MKREALWQPLPGSVELARVLFGYVCAVVGGLAAYVAWSPL